MTGKGENYFIQSSSPSCCLQLETVRVIRHEVRRCTAEAPVVDMAFVLPYEVIERIVGYTNIGDMDEAALVGSMLSSSLSSAQIAQLMADRKSPVRYLRTLTRHPDKLLEAMRNTKSILAGSRAVAYFSPDACAIDSDWDFYCQGDLILGTAFTVALSGLGFTWEDSVELPGRKDSHGSEEYPSSGMLFNILRGTVTTKGVTHNVQVMWIDRRAATTNVIGFHSSLTQCFVSGFCAVSMYHHLTRRQLFFHWGHNDRDRMANRKTTARGESNYSPDSGGEQLQEQYEYSTQRSATVANKYTARGFSCIRYDSPIGLVSHHGSLRTVSPTAGVRIRHVSDGGSYVVPFDKYISLSNLDACLYLIYALGTIGMLAWLERAGRTTAVPTFKYMDSHQVIQLHYYFLKSSSVQSLEGIAMSVTDRGSATVEYNSAHNILETWAQKWPWMLRFVYTYDYGHIAASRLCLL
jgi:hypothetical protein